MSELGKLRGSMHASRADKLIIYRGKGWDGRTMADLIDATVGPENSKQIS